MKYLTLGVIGHVDHGKTELVKALSGTDTDRLREEKARGISIILGYAHLDLPAGTLGIIDAPGHEKFVKTMIAGATGSDTVLLAVDVNEGIKPQTIEHLEIARLLGIERCVAAITKCDLADSEVCELAEAELADYLKETPFQSARIVHTSAKTGEGLDEIRDALNQILLESSPPIDEGYAYLPVDRVFSKAGFGTVVTGTLRRGSIRVGDTLDVLPGGARAVVRELQTHDAAQDVCMPGRRTAVNLRGVEKLSLERGDVLAAAGSITGAGFVSVELHLLDSAPSPLKHRQRVRFLYGAAETYGRAHLLDRDALEPGASCVMQFQLDDPVAIPNYEPFVIRTYSPMRTIGGGRILESLNHRYRRRRAENVKRLEVFARRDPAEMLREELRRAGLDGVDTAAFALQRRLESTLVDKATELAECTKVFAKLLIDGTAFDAFSEQILRAIASFHEKHRTERGISLDALANALQLRPDVPVLNATLDRLVAASRVAREQGLIRLAQFTPEGALSADERAAAESIEAAFRDAGLEPPDLVAVLQNGAASHVVYKYLLDEGQLVATSLAGRKRTPGNTIVFHAANIESAKARLLDRFGASGGFTTAEAKELLGVSRKYLIPLLEHLDKCGFTRRRGERRAFAAARKPS